MRQHPSKAYNMKEEEFRKALRKYQSGRASVQQRKMIDAWYDEMGGDGSDPQIDPDFGKRYWANIQKYIEEDDARKQSGNDRKNSTIKFWYVGIAASVLIAASFFFFVIKDPQTRYSTTKEIASDTRWEVRQNSESLPKCFMLADGSTITLHPGSTAKFSDAFNLATREIYLEGEAFFEVMPNKNKPFLVHTKEVTTTVLGTSFNIRALNGENKVIVDVKTGKVTVKTNVKNDDPARTEVILTPNQRIIFNQEDKKLAKGIVEDPLPILDQQEIKRMRFEDAPVSIIFEAIEKMYGVDLVFDKQNFETCLLTTSLTDGNLYNRLDIITNAIGMSYEVIDDKIAITGKGCN